MNLTLKLKDSTLLRSAAFIDGDWSGADDGGSSVVRNPANGSVVGSIPTMGVAETRRAIMAAHRAQPQWASLVAKERAAILRRIANLMLTHIDDLVVIMTAEQGKPVTEAAGEIAFAASFLEWFAEEGRRVYGEIVPTFRADTRLLVLRQPVGVAAAITPWNFPSAMITRKLGPALAAGCSFVCKPAPQTPFSALALAELAQRAGLPRGVFNIVTGDAEAIGGELTANPLVRKLSFTGSTSVGKRLLVQCANTVKKVSLELGGNAPFIVFDDADVDEAVRGAIASKYRNTGQTCVCANRIYVQSGIYADFAERLAAEVGKFRVGDGLAGPTDQGPLIDARALEKVRSHIADAVKRGARIACGGKAHPLGGNFFEPTVLTDVTPDMRVSQEETFGPVAPLLRFETEAEVLQMANDTQYGLAAYFYTRDPARIWRMQESLEYGIVSVNTGVFSTEVAPFGGLKESGLGREGSRHGIEEYTELKYVCVGGLRNTPEESLERS